MHIQLNANYLKTVKFSQVDPRICMNGKMRRLQKIISNYYQKGLVDFNVKGSMLSILFIIAKNKDMLQKRIAHQLVLDPSTLSRDIKKLQQRGFIKISRGEDQRATLLNITKKGLIFLDEVSPVWMNLQNQITEILGDTQIKSLDKILTKAQNELR